MNRTTRCISIACVTLALGVLAGCADKAEPPVPLDKTAKVPKEAPPPPPAPVASMAVAVADIAGGAGSKVGGTVTFKDTGNGISIEAHLTGLTPGKHGFHIHAAGDCSGDFTAAGAHFNPENHAHGGPDSAEAHDGDMGNLLAGADGTAMITMTSRHITLDQGPTSVIGKSVIVHEKEDDLATQPTGNSGNRIACGVIKLQEGAPAAEPAAPVEGAAPTGASGDGATH